MKAVDLSTAQVIVQKLGELAADRRALANPEKAGIRCQPSSRYVEASKAIIPKIAALLLDDIYHREAELRRRAAQIGLSL